MSLALVRARADAESRQSEEKRQIERKRNIIVLTARYLLDLGYIDSVRQIETDTNISLDRLDVADNVDLPTILTEYEDFYEMRFGRRPKITRKVGGDESQKDKRGQGGVRLPPPENPAYAAAAAEAANVDNSGNGSRRGARRERSQSAKHARAQSEDSSSRRDRPPRAPAKTPENEPAPTEPGAGSFDGGLVGQSVASGNANGKKEKDQKGDEAMEKGGDDPFDNQIIRALPNFGADKEYRDLAIGISRDILTRNPGIKWDTIVGLGHAKALLKEAVVMPLKYPQLFTGLLAPWKGVLLFGPPGTGKTLLAKAVATECETTFFNISASTVVSKWRGDSEKLIRVLFDLARHHQPSTIFIDELDSLMGARGGGDGEHEGSRRMKTELLIQMDGLLRDTQDQVFLLAASNLPWDLDSAMLRRLEKRILVDLPNAEAREAMFKAHLPESFASSLDYGRLAGLTEGWSGSDLRLLCKEAAMHPLRRLMADIESAEAQVNSTMPAARGGNRQRAVEKAAAAAAGTQELKVGLVTSEDVERALRTVHRAPGGLTEKYAEWQEQFGAA